MRETGEASGEMKEKRNAKQMSVGGVITGRCTYIFTFKILRGGGGGVGCVVPVFRIRGRTERGERSKSEFEMREWIKGSEENIRKGKGKQLVNGLFSKSFRIRYYINERGSGALSLEIQIHLTD